MIDLGFIGYTSCSSLYLHRGILELQVLFEFSKRKSHIPFPLVRSFFFPFPLFCLYIMDVLWAL